MRTPKVVKGKIALQCLFDLRYGIVAVEINLLIFDRPSQSLDKDVVLPAAFAVHTDPDTMLVKDADKSGAGELAALVGIHDLGGALFQDCLLKRINAGIRG